MNPSVQRWQWVRVLFRFPHHGQSQGRDVPPVFRISRRDEDLQMEPGGRAESSAMWMGGEGERERGREGERERGREGERERESEEERLLQISAWLVQYPVFVTLLRIQPARFKECSP
ncbi:hypothetical protein CA833_19460 [Novosphingobium sp. KA1]|nr:hypothetical protein CA833_19460 [Novosphingobium sp. KA1]